MSSPLSGGVKQNELILKAFVFLLHTIFPLCSWKGVEGEDYREMVLMFTLQRNGGPLEVHIKQNHGSTVKQSKPSQ